MDYGRSERADRLAAEYVLGTLRGRARSRFEALLPAHPLLRSAVREWQERLVPLSAAVAPQTPSANVWKRIEERLFGNAGAHRPGIDGAAPRERWFARLAFWRSFAALASVAAIALAVALAGPSKPPVIVVLAPAAPGIAPANASFVASISGDGRSLVTRPIVNVAIAPDRALELWAVPPNAGPGNGPRSLGLIAPSGATVVRRSQLLDNAEALAVSLEPPGGSPTGAPTGPVLFAGPL